MDGIIPVFKAKQVSCSFCVGNADNFMLILRWIIPKRSCNFYTCDVKVPVALSPKR